jgi:protocatechuate 3,4-dioxygenase beta subunit
MDNDDTIVGRLLTRRELVALFGISGVAALVHPAAGQLAGAPSGGGIVGCVVQPQQTEGPYFVDEKLNRPDIRIEPGTGALKPGLPLDLTFKVSEIAADGACVPLGGAQVDLWQCDAMGIYSGVRDANFDTVGQKFLRGHQVTDAGGTARFVTIYPGWYPGRAVHIHFKVRTQPAAAAKGYEFTSQLYFDDDLSDRVFAREPYSAHTGTRTKNNADRIFGNGGTQLLLQATESERGCAATFSLAMQPGDPVPAGRGRRGAGARHF